MAAASSIPTTKQKNSNQAPIVSLQNLAQRFKTPTGQIVTALENINLDIYPNEFISIIGPSC